MSLVIQSTPAADGSARLEHIVDRRLRPSGVLADVRFARDAPLRTRRPPKKSQRSQPILTNRSEIRASPLSLIEASRGGNDPAVWLPPGLDDSSRASQSSASERHLELLDWTDRQLRADKIGSIPEHLNPILQPIGLDIHGWCDVVRKFGRIFNGLRGLRSVSRREACRRVRAGSVRENIRWASGQSDSTPSRLAIQPGNGSGREAQRCSNYSTRRGPVRRRVS